VWAGAPTAYAYAWARCDDAAGTSCAPLASGTKTYALASADVGKHIEVTVTASNASGSASASSLPTAAIADVASPPPPSGTRLFFAGMEGGNLGEWSSGGGGGMFNSGTFEALASGDVAHTGSYSLRAKVWTLGGDSGVRAFRWAEPRANREASYAAWFF